MYLAAALVLALAGSPEAQFWSWFAQNAPRVATIKTGHEPIAGELAAQLNRVDGDLTWEVGVTQEPKELVISASGIQSAFPVVKRLVAAAPPISGWKIVAFRPRRKANLVIDFGDYRLDPAKAWFKASPRRGKLDIQVFVPDYRDSEAVKQAAFLLLDGLLGEYDVETRIAAIEIQGVPANPMTAGLRPVAELPTAVDALKREQP
jgi:hypothetical protein